MRSEFRLAIVALLAALVVTITVAPSGETAGRVVRSQLAGENVRLTLPTGSGDPRGLVIWFHGQGGNVNDRIDGPWLGALVRNGYAIASSDFHLQSWGNPESTEDATLLIDWARQQIDAPIVLWVSGSMGGAVSLNALVHGVEPPPCWYGVKPAINLRKMGNVPTATRYIGEAYDGEVPADRNPIDNLDRLPDDVRYRVVASEGDDWVPIFQNAGPLVSTLEERGAEASYFLAEGPHMDPSHWDAADLVAFADSCAE
ncbi:S9 family peptidase [Nocardioides sp. R-C-SC26]|uniref:alpha/beta hydrolase family protein n=1 Tax=Nocardioides sp. R-C-SC26 TaxID=2870414 RepID=UPI001E3C7C9A|nr:alpha/beta hydrolase [Nocardioides sp. R-C-SC26]